MTRTSRLNPGGDERVAMLVALPLSVWKQIRAEASDLGIGPSKLIEPVLLQAFGSDPVIDEPEDDDSKAHAERRP